MTKTMSAISSLSTSFLFHRVAFHLQSIFCGNKRSFFNCKGRDNIYALHPNQSDGNKNCLFNSSSSLHKENSANHFNFIIRKLHFEIQGSTTYSTVCPWQYRNIHPFCRPDREPVVTA